METSLSKLQSKVTKLETENLKLRDLLNDRKMKQINAEVQLKYYKNNLEKLITKEVDKAKNQLIKENEELKYNLSNAYNEINRLKLQLNNGNDDKDNKKKKLSNQVNKNSSNSSIPTSKEITCKIKRTNEYNPYLVNFCYYST